MDNKRRAHTGRGREGLFVCTCGDRRYNRPSTPCFVHHSCADVNAAYRALHENSRQRRRVEDDRESSSRESDIGHEGTRSRMPKRKRKERRVERKKSPGLLPKPVLGPRSLVPSTHSYYSLYRCKITVLNRSQLDNRPQDNSTAKNQPRAHA